jgi:transcription elongation factor GreA
MATQPTFLTPEARAQLAAELDELQNVTRVELIARIAEARAQGDLSENAEYHAARNAQSFVMGRIRELEHILRTAQDLPTVESAPQGIVYLGSTVVVRDEDGDDATYQIRGSTEANPRAGIVSNESPIGSALLGKRVGDNVKVVSPGGSYEVKIIKVG